MIGIDAPSDTPLLDWNEQSLSELPTGTVTLLLADVEGSTRLWESQSDTMATALEHLNHTVNDLVDAHGGVRPVEQGEGDSFVVAFARASDAVACALARLRSSKPSWRRSAYASACTPARSSYAMPATTPDPPSTAPRDYATSRTAGRPSFPARPNRWWSIGCRPKRG
jgi:Adenylate and Guanylate cyclase catalytic domain